MDETHARIEANIIIKQNNLSLKIMSLPTMLKIAYKRKIIQNYLDTLYQLYRAGYMPSCLDKDTLFKLNEE